MKPRSSLSFGLALFAIVGMIGATGNLAYADPAETTGNGIPKELQKNTAYKLNVIGMKKSDKDFSNDETDNGKRIFVPLQGKTKILLNQTFDGSFNVADFDGMDGEAIFELPKPNLACTDFNTDPELNGGNETTTECDSNVTSYFVFARALGAPNGATMVFNTCADEAQDGIDYNQDGDYEDHVCSVESLEAGKDDDKPRKGGAKFTNVTKELLTICVDILDDDVDGDGVAEEGDGQCDIRADIFDKRLENYVWELDNNGRKLVQLWFVQAPQTNLPS
jgi:hypothetical protein